MITKYGKDAKPFLQSGEWEEFQRRLGRKTRRILEKLVVKHDLPFGASYLYSPRPNFDNSDDFKNFLEDAAGFAGEEKSIFLKIEPEKNFQFSIFNFQFNETHPLQPQKTLIIDLSKTEDVLLSEMHPKTRYNIRLAIKHGVVVNSALWPRGGTPRGKVVLGTTTRQERGAFSRGGVKRANTNELKRFLTMLEETSRRESFHTHSREHYQKLLEVCTDNFWNELFFAEYKGKTLAAAFVNFYRPSGTVTYLHGASSRDHKELMAPHLLHWEAIRYAKSTGFSSYDFWGIDEKRWPGVTRFKLGFGGKVLEYPGALDTVYHPALYALYRAYRFTRQNI